MNCDFCFAENPTWEFPAETYVDPKNETRSLGAWMACDACAAYICRDDYIELVKQRSLLNPTMKLLVAVAGTVRAKEEAMRMWRDFAKHRKGEPHRI